MAAFGAVMLVPVALGLRSMRAGLATAAAGNRIVLAPVRRSLAEAGEHVADRVAAIRAEVETAAGVGHAAPGAEVEIVAGRRSDAGPQAEPPAFARAHAAGGRLRLVARTLEATEGGEAVAAAVAAFPGVVRARWRPASASLVIDAALPADRLAEGLDRAGLIRLRGSAAPPPAAQGTALLLGWLDGLIRMRSRGAADLDHVIAMGVLAAALAGRDPAFAGIPPEDLVSRVMARRRVSRG